MGSSSSPTRTMLFALHIACAVLGSRPAADAEEEPRDFGPAARAAKLLASPLAREQEEGEKELRGQGESLRRTLVAGLASGDLREQAIAARLLRVLVSPWARGIEMGLNSDTLVFQPRRPVERAESHPWASEVRKTALERLQALLEGKAARETGSREQASFTYEEFGAASYLSLLLVEVGDAGMLDEVARMLAALRRDDSSRFLMYVLEGLYGLPAFHEEAGGICGPVSEEQFRKFTVAASARLRAAKRALLAWHARHRAEPEEALVKSVLARYGQELPVGWISESSPPSSDQGLRLIRLGKAALPSILERKARATRLMDRGKCELFIASVTGKADPAVVRVLFAAGDEEASLACTIVVWAGSKEWKPELKAFLGKSAAAGPARGPLLSRTAAAALAACHRKEALPALQAHHRAYPDAGLGDLIRRIEESAESPAPADGTRSVRSRSLIQV